MLRPTLTLLVALVLASLSLARAVSPPLQGVVFPPTLRCWAAGASIAGRSNWPRASPPNATGPVAVIGHQQVKGNDHGFEGGKGVLVDDGIYHVFTAATFAEPYGTATRLEHWSSGESGDRRRWTRHRTLLSSDSVAGAVCKQHDLHAAAWEPVPVYDPQRSRWVVMYTAYECNGTPGIVGNGAYNGSIWHLVSTVRGRAGINGPYQPVGLVFHGDTQVPTGLGVDTFHPYGPINGTWYALTSIAGVSGAGCVSLVSAPALTGATWRWVNRSIGSRSWWYLENPAVNSLPGGGWVALLDGLGGRNRSRGCIGCEAAGMVVMYSRDRRWWDPTLYEVQLPGGCRTSFGFASL